MIPADPGTRAALLLALLFVAAMVAGYVVFAIYNTLAGGGLPSLSVPSVVIAAFGLLVLLGSAIYRRR